MTTIITTGTVSVSGTTATCSTSGAWANAGGEGLLVVKIGTDNVRSFAVTAKTDNQTVTVSPGIDTAVTGKSYALISAFDLASLTDAALNDISWLAAWMKTAGQGLTGQIATGSANAIQLAVANITRLSDAPYLLFRPSAANTGPVTIQVNSLAPVGLVDGAGASLSSGTLTAQMVVGVQFDASNNRYVLLFPTTPGTILRYDAQTLTSGQQSQARANIAAASSADAMSLSATGTQTMAGPLKVPYLSITAAAGPYTGDITNASTHRQQPANITCCACCRAPDRGRQPAISARAAAL